MPVLARFSRCFGTATTPVLHCVSTTLPAGSSSPPPPPVVFLHGLLGSSTNFRTIQLAVSKHRPTLAFDLRNHGRSPHTAGACTLDDLAGDVAASLAAPGSPAAGQRVTVVGHSLGGKVAMRLALLHPDLLHSLCVIDIAPARYDQASPGWRAVQGVVQAAASLDPTAMPSRQAIDAALAALVPDPGVRSFVAQNLTPREGGGYGWRLGWQSILASMPHFADWPQAPSQGQQQLQQLQAHFIRGTRSTYIAQHHLPGIQQLFPRAELHAVEAGHWVHAENPKGFWEVLTKVLGIPA